MKKLCIITFSVIIFLNGKAQLINYVNNGSFEVCGNCPNYFPVLNAKYWNGIDSTKWYGMLVSALPPSNQVPLSSFTYQWPRTGNNFLLSTLLAISNSTNTIRGYPRNILRMQLKPGITYCVSFFINVTNNSTYGVDAVGAFFSDQSTDTISQCNSPITYLTPQVENQAFNFITDTLNWVSITGTFTALGIEKYMLLGNFNSDQATHSIVINPTFLPTIITEVLYDDVSVFELEAAAYAGPDTVILSGDSVYIGSPRDFASDEVCRWYLLPDMSTPIDTAAAGLWVKPTVTSTYVVRQQLWCSGVKWDTVTVYVDYVGIPGSRSFSSGFGFEVFPNPADEILEIRLSEHKVNTTIPTLRFFNHLGMQVREEEVLFRDGAAKIDVRDLETGIYFIELVFCDEVVGRKRLLLAH